MKLSTAFPLMILLISSLAYSCSYVDTGATEVVVEEEATPSEEIGVYPGVDEALWPYFSRYEAAARTRGIQVDLVADEITGIIEELSDGNVAGQCTYNSHNPNHVIIDESFWNNASDRSREFVVFHELGHCDLLRDHREAAHTNGNCISIMRSGLEDCRDNYNVLTRESYLDELFDPIFRDELIGG